MRYFLTVFLVIFTILPIQTYANATDNTEDSDMASVIIEVKGDPSEHKTYIEDYFPYVDIVAVYETLFNGLALKASPERLEKMGSLDFIKAVHPVTTYETQFDVLTKETENAVIPAALNNTTYTGEGVDVAVIDTGIDYTHPALDQNYMGGYDLVDLDSDPMETLQAQGAPTMHGTHVAGIIAADGKMKGVAPDANIYAYRALGPGGRGSSVQVIAALEQAVHDGMDVINLSLGNSVNGPDFPTSVAVNRAVELGVTVVIANGNDGPGRWTVGSPATATRALSVGASTSTHKVPYLFETLHDKKIQLTEMVGSVSWDFETDYQVAPFPGKDIQGKIAIIERGKIPFYKLAKKAQAAGAVAVLIYNNEPGTFRGSIGNAEEPIDIPVASISKQAGEWVMNQSKDQALYMETKYQTMKPGIAAFSSRGPVTVNWDVKPGVIAPGANIVSTVPGGYAKLQGTSMAAPHVTGAVALLKEAHPDWTTKQVKGALKTTANRMKKKNGKPLHPIAQGMGKIQPKAAINTPTIIYNPLLSYGKIESYSETKTIGLTIENTTDHEQTYTFRIPKQQRGISWHLPQTFTIPKGETKTVPVEVSINSASIDEGIHQGWLTLTQDNQRYRLPYLFINQSADYPKAMGFEFSLKPFSDDTYVYHLYVTAPTESVEVNLYNPDTLVYDRTFLRSEDIQVGMNEGFFDKSELGKPGTYLAVITVHLKNGQTESYQTMIRIERKGLPK